MPKGLISAQAAVAQVSDLGWHRTKWEPQVYMLAEILKDPTKQLGLLRSEVGDRVRKDKLASICILVVLLFSFSSKARKFKQLQNSP